MRATSTEASDTTANTKHTTSPLPLPSSTVATPPLQDLSPLGGGTPDHDVFLSPPSPTQATAPWRDRSPLGGGTPDHDRVHDDEFFAECKWFENTTTDMYDGSSNGECAPAEAAPAPASYSVPLIPPQDVTNAAPASFSEAEQMPAEEVRLATNGWVDPVPRAPLRVPVGNLVCNLIFVENTHRSRLEEAGSDIFILRPDGGRLCKGRVIPFPCPVKNMFAVELVNEDSNAYS